MSMNSEVSMGVNKPEEQKPMEDARSVVQSFQDKEAMRCQEAAKAALKAAMNARMSVY